MSTTVCCSLVVTAPVWFGTSTNAPNRPLNVVLLAHSKGDLSVMFDPLCICRRTKRYNAVINMNHASLHVFIIIAVLYMKVITAHMNGTLAIWDTTTGGIKHVMHEHEGAVTFLQWLGNDE